MVERAAFTAPAGELVTRSRPDGDGTYLAFLPAPLPPPEATEQAAEIKFGSLLGDAEHWVGRLVGIAEVLPNPNILVRPYLRQEAVRSSEIEGTRASFTDLVAFEVDANAPAGSDVRDVANYVTALETGLRRIQDGGRIDADLVRDLHRTLMVRARGEAMSNPGEFRTLQNHVGGAGTNDPAEAKFVPPPPEEMQLALGAFFDYLANPRQVSPLLDLAWVHYQFETIHPFQDGNGRVGRILIPLLLAERRDLAHPLLYLSPYFNRHRTTYYQKLFAVSAESDWVGWLRFVLEAILEQANSAVTKAQRVIALGEEWRGRLASLTASPTAYRLSDLVHERYLAINVGLAEGALKAAGQAVSRPTVYSAIAVLEQAGILQELTGRARDRMWLASEMVALLEA